MVVQISRQPQPTRNQTLLIWRLCNPCLSVSSHCACMNVLLCQILQIEQNCVRGQSCVKLYLFSHNSNIFKKHEIFFRFLFSFNQNNCCNLDEQRFGLWQQQSAGLCHPSPHFVHSPPIQHYLVYLYRVWQKPCFEG